VCSLCSKEVDLSPLHISNDIRRPYLYLILRSSVELVLHTNSVQHNNKIFSLCYKKCDSVFYFPTKQHKHRKLQVRPHKSRAALFLIKHGAMKMYWGEEIYLHAFLNSILHGRIWSVSHTHHSLIYPVSDQYIHLATPFSQARFCNIVLIIDNKV
jgi:hypothetical protein